MELKELLPYIAGIVLSLAFSYIPGLKDWYDKQAGWKAPIMLGLLILVAGAYYGLSCTPWAANLGITLTCDEIGLQAILIAFVQIVLANQATYLLTKRD